MPQNVDVLTDLEKLQKKKRRAKLNAQKYYQKHKEAIKARTKAYSKIYYQEHKEDQKAQARRNYYAKRNKVPPKNTNYLYPYVPATTLFPFIFLKHGYKLDEPIIVYFVSIQLDTGETFYKVGVTKHTVFYRYTGLKGTYQVLGEATMPAQVALSFESAFIAIFRRYKYEPQDFGGYSECFSVNLKEPFNIMIPDKFKEETK